MKNYVQPGRVITLTAPYALTSGQGALVGTLFSVASGDAANGATFEGVTEGVFDLAKVAATAITAGAKVYWDNAARNVTTTVGSNTLIGCAIVAAATNDTTVRVRLNGTVV